MTSRGHLVFLTISTVIVISAIGWGFVLVGSPYTRRLERLDEQRLEDLQTIASSIQSMVVNREDVNALKEELPKTLEEAIERNQGQKLTIRDPQTGEPYAYEVVNESTFKLCASFAFPRDSDYNVFWNHPAGEHCFEVDVLKPPGY